MAATRSRLQRHGEVPLGDLLRCTNGLGWWSDGERSWSRAFVAEKPEPIMEAMNGEKWLIRVDTVVDND